MLTMSRPLYMVLLLIRLFLWDWSTPCHMISSHGCLPTDFALIPLRCNWSGLVLNNSSLNLTSLSCPQCTHFTFSSSVRDLGATLDSTLSFSDHLSQLTRSCYYHLRRLRAIRRSVSSSVFKTVVHAFICCRIDYCNSLFAGLPKVRLSSLQSVMNSAARLIARLPHYFHFYLHDWCSSLASCCLSFQIKVAYCS
jgi:hypothetical protein